MNVQLARRPVRLQVGVPRPPVVAVTTVSTVVSVVLLLVAMAGCGAGERPNQSTAATSPEQPRPATPPPAAEQPHIASDDRPRVVVLGDSLTAGLGLHQRDAYPTLLQQKIEAAGYNYLVVNAGVSGDTSAGGLSRLDWALEGDVRVLIVALGGNDALRALPVTELRQNLSRVIEQAQARGIQVILAGMESPPNFGRDYVVSFHQVYPALAKQYGVPLLPFLLEGVAGVDRLNQNDGIHPTAEGARIVADHVWTILEPVLRRGSAAPRGEAPPG
jgi:acyl-CoA thioesterase-1